MQGSQIQGNFKIYRPLAMTSQQRLILQSGAGLQPKQNIITPRQPFKACVIFLFNFEFSYSCIFFLSIRKMKRKLLRLQMGKHHICFKIGCLMNHVTSCTSRLYDFADQLHFNKGTAADATVRQITLYQQATLLHSL